MKYLAWEDFKRGDVLYDAKLKICITICSKFYNVYSQKMITADSDKGQLITLFDDNRFLKVTKR